FDVFAGKKSAQIREILISESAWEEMTCLFAPSLGFASVFGGGRYHLNRPAVYQPLVPYGGILLRHADVRCFSETEGVQIIGDGGDVY
ncbi:MAG: hypothetical protein E7H83_26175, partial [Enterobacteriaceae bacterium]|nr:hypothetical protein [Enterobacteriaceae bacterium]